MIDVYRSSIYLIIIYPVLRKRQIFMTEMRSRCPITSIKRITDACQFAKDNDKADVVILDKMKEINSIPMIEPVTAAYQYTESRLH